MSKVKLKIFQKGLLLNFEITKVLLMVDLQRNQKRSQATKPSGEDDDMVVLDDDQGPGLQSGNTDMFDLDKMDSSGKGQPGSNNNSEDDFCCWKCNRSLLGYRFVNKDANSYCVNCYHELFANTCESCNDTITVDDQVKYDHSKFRSSY